MFGAYWIAGLSNKVNVLVNTIESVNSMREDITSHNHDSQIHFSDTKHLANLEKWQTCDIQHCVHLQQLFSRLDKLNERFDQFDKRADETRNNTSVSLQGINNAQKELGKDLGKELGDLAKMIMNLLVEDLRRRDK